MATFYVTTPIYYANSEPHLGSLYTTLVADCLKRYKRQRGYETFFLTGTDEHGINIQRVAERTGRTPRQHTDAIVAEFKRVFAEFGLDEAHGGYDIFMRTTEPFHYEGVSALWRRIASNKTPKGRDAIYKGYYEGWFCAPCAAFKTEDEYIEPESAGGPPRCAEHLVPLDRVSEESYFFRLSDYGESLLALYESRPDFVQPDVRLNEVASFVRSGLQDLSVSRRATSVKWGIPVPGDPSHTIYVWLDALTNYITAIGFGNEEREKVAGFEKFWPALHLVGKDILRFHAVYWPAFLLAADLAPPRTVFAHGMWQDADGRRMSKTLGNTIDLEILRRHFPNDAVRYFCLREMVFGQDGRFGYEALIDRANSDLANGIGNLSSRTLTMIERYCDGLIPDSDLPETVFLAAKRAGIDADPQALASALGHVRDTFTMHMDNLSFSRALEAVWGIVARLDKTITDARPWILAKDPAQKPILDAVLYRAAESLRWLGVLLYPVMPETTINLWQQLGQDGDPSLLDPAKLTWGSTRAGTRIGKVAALFPRIELAKTMKEIRSESSAESGFHMTEADAVQGAAVPTGSATPPQHGATEADGMGAQMAARSGTDAPDETGVIEISDFAKVDLRVGEVLTAERVPKSDKLLRCLIDLGEEKPRQILAGIAEFYEPQTLVGRKVIVVANLKPRKLRGLESQGMVVAASVGEEGRPVIATFTEDVPNGARLK